MKLEVERYENRVWRAFIPMTKPLLSVVIPVWNGERYLREAIESVLIQDVSRLQIIVVDDGSTDETERVARAFPQIEYSKQVQSGAATARNNGVQQARGELLAFLDADDIWMQGKIARQIEVFETVKNGAPPLIFGHVQNFFSPDLDEATRLKTRISDEAMPAYLPSGMLLRTEDFRRVGDFGTTWEIGEFLDWYGRALESGFRSHLLPEIVLRRRVHATNQGMTKRDFQRDYVRVCKAAIDRRRKMMNAE